MGKLFQAFNALGRSKSATPEVKRRASFLPPSAGVRLGDEDYPKIDAVFACVRVLSESVASLPLDIMRKTPDGQRAKATDETLHELLRWQPNPEMTAYEFREWLMVDSCLRGNGFAQVVRDGNGDPIELWPLSARKVKVKRKENGRIQYSYNIASKKGETAELNLNPEDVLVVPCFVVGGLLGHGIADLQRDLFSTAKAASDYAADFFANAASPQGALSVQDALDDEAYMRLKESWEKTHSGSGNRSRTVILEQGMTYEPFRLDHEEAQLLETYKFLRSRVAGVFRVPAHMINDLEKSTFSNVEHLDLAFVKHSLRPWLQKWEQRIRMTLIPESRRGELYAKFNTADMLRGDLPSRYDSYSKAIAAGFLSPNDVRRIEDQNPYEGGDTYFIQGANVPVRGEQTGQQT